MGRRFYACPFIYLGEFMPLTQALIRAVFMGESRAALRGRLPVNRLKFSNANFQEASKLARAMRSDAESTTTRVLRSASQGRQALNSSRPLPKSALTQSDYSYGKEYLYRGQIEFQNGTVKSYQFADDELLTPSQIRSRIREFGDQTIETNKKYDEKRRTDADAKHKQEELDKPTSKYTDKELDAPGASNLTSIRKITPLGAFISA